MSKKMNALIENLKFDIETEFPFLSESEREDMLLDILYESDKTTAKHTYGNANEDDIKASKVIKRAQRRQVRGIKSKMGQRYGKNYPEFFKDRDAVKARRLAALIDRANPETGGFFNRRKIRKANRDRLNLLMGSHSDVAGFNFNNEKYGDIYFK